MENQKEFIKKVLIISAIAALHQYFGILSFRLLLQLDL